MGAVGGNEDAEWALARLLGDDWAAGHMRVVEWGPVYLQWAPDLPGTVVVELVSNRFLDVGDQLSPAEEGLLLNAGFDEPTPERPNWTTWVASQHEALVVARACVHALSRAYRLPRNSILWAIRAQRSGSGSKEAPRPLPDTEDRSLARLVAMADDGSSAVSRVLRDRALGSATWEQVMAQVPPLSDKDHSTYRALHAAEACGVLSNDEYWQVCAAINAWDSRPVSGALDKLGSGSAAARLLADYATGASTWDDTVSQADRLDWRDPDNWLALRTAESGRLIAASELAQLREGALDQLQESAPQGYQVITRADWDRDEWLSILRSATDIDGMDTALVIPGGVEIPNEVLADLQRIRIQYRVLPGPWEDADSAAGGVFYVSPVQFGVWVPDEGPRQWRALVPDGLTLPAPAESPPPATYEPVLPDPLPTDPEDDFAGPVSESSLARQLTRLDEQDSPQLRERILRWLAADSVDGSSTSLLHLALSAPWGTACGQVHQPWRIGRLAVIRNPQIDIDSLELLTQDRDPLVRQAAQGRLHEPHTCAVCANAKDQLAPVVTDLGSGSDNESTRSGGEAASARQATAHRCAHCGALWRRIARLAAEGEEGTDEVEAEPGWTAISLAELRDMRTSPRDSPASARSHGQSDPPGS